MIYLIRHGKDDDTIRGGWSNHGLTGEGVKQAENLANKLLAEGVRFDCIYSSDLARAKQTAYIIADTLNVPVVLSKAFREVNNGVLAGMKNDEAKEEQAVEKLLSMLPETQKAELSDLFSEMSALKTDEAKLFKALDNLEAIISHNEANISTWLPREYEENLTYGTKNCEWSEWTKNFREELKKDSERKIEENQ